MAEVGWHPGELPSRVGFIVTNLRRPPKKVVLHALAYNVAKFLRTLALPGEVERWSLTAVREKVVKIGAKIVRHSRDAIFQIAEVAVPRELFACILDRIARLRPPSSGPCRRERATPHRAGRDRMVSCARKSAGKPERQMARPP